MTKKEMAETQKNLLGVSLGYKRRRRSKKKVIKS